MKLLVSGATGLLGTALIETNRYLPRIDAVYLGNYHMVDNQKAGYFNADVCDRGVLDDVFNKVRPEIVVHTAGIADTDYCQNNYNSAWHSNVFGTNVIIELCKKYNSNIVYVSTNAVFDGCDAPYSEESVPHPVNNYGKIKLECEMIVKKSRLKYLIVRPILMYGWNNIHERLNFATWLIKKLGNGEQVNIVDDVYENPLFNHSCAEAIWGLIMSDKEGVYHIADRDVVSRYEFSKIIAEVFSLRQDLITPVSSDFFPKLAPRPPNTSYTTVKIEQELKFKPLGIREGLLLMRGRQLNS